MKRVSSARNSLARYASPNFSRPNGDSESAEVPARHWREGALFVNAVALLPQRSTLGDGVGALGKTCAAAGPRDGQAGGLAERSVRRGLLCLLVLRAASRGMVPPTRQARGTSAHVGLC